LAAARNLKLIKNCTQFATFSLLNFALHKLFFAVQEVLAHLLHTHLGRFLPVLEPRIRARLFFAIAVGADLEGAFVSNLKI